MTNKPKNLNDAREIIASLESRLAGRPTPPGQKPLDNPHKPGKPTPPRTNPPSNPKPIKPFSASAIGNAVVNVMSGRMSLDEAREAIKAAATIKAKLEIIGEVQTNLRTAIEACGTNMVAKSPLYRKLQAANEAEAYALLAQDVELGPRGAKALTLLRRSGLE
jgi:hypothetical protein